MSRGRDARASRGCIPFSQNAAPVRLHIRRNPGGLAPELMIPVPPIRTLAVLASWLVLAGAVAPAAPVPGSSLYNLKGRGNKAQPTTDPAAAPPPAAANRGPVAPSDETLTRMIRLRSRLRNLDMKWEDVNGDEVMTAFSANLGGGRVTAESHINWTRPQGAHRARIRLENVRVSDFLNATDIRLDARFDTSISGQLDLSWTGLRMREMRRTLTGGGVFTAGPGTISSTRILDALADFSGIRELRRFDFDTARLDAKAENGRVLVKAFRLRGPYMRTNLKGSVDLESDALAMDLELELNPAVAERSTRIEVREGFGLFTRLAGREGPGEFVEVPLPFSFGGTMAHPRAVLKSLPSGPPERKP